MIDCYYVMLSNLALPPGIYSWRDVGEDFSVNKIERDHDAFVALEDEPTTAVSDDNTVDILDVDIKNSFESTRSTDATWQEMLSKNIKTHGTLKGKFEVEKSFRFLRASGP
jgi:hypothetical protein